MALSSATTCRSKAHGRRTQPSSTTAAPRPYSLILIAAIVMVAFFARPADCQAEKRLSSVHQQQYQQQQQQYYDSEDHGMNSGEVVKNKIRPESYSQDQSYEKHSGKQQIQSDAVGSASTVYGEQYVVGTGGGGNGGVLLQDQPLLDEEAQESISSGSLNNHRIPQYTRGGSPVPSDVIEGKNVGNRAIGNNYHPGVGNPSATAAGYAVDSAYNNPHYSTQDLIQDQNYQLEFKYHDYDKMTKFLRTTSSRFPNLTALYSIGKSVQGTCIHAYIVIYIYTNIAYSV